MPNDDPSKHYFGSRETERKLGVLKAYLESYCVALRNQKFARIYIDGFAGTGSRTETRAVIPFLGQGEHSTEEVTTPGSASIALGLNPGFNIHVFIEQDETKIAALKAAIGAHPKTYIRQGDANDVISNICKHYRWKKEKLRGVVFLDPYGMQVSWPTVEAIAATEALDCWYFFPLSGLYRNAPYDPSQLDSGKINALNRVLGTDQWQTDWYSQESQPVQYDLWGKPIEDKRRTSTVGAIETWVHDRLARVFKGVVLKPLRLYHANGAPMASLFFAVSNPSAAAVRLASEIAGHILKAGMSSQNLPR